MDVVETFSQRPRSDGTYAPCLWYNNFKYHFTDKIRPNDTRVFKCRDGKCLAFIIAGKDTDGKWKIKDDKNADRHKHEPTPEEMQRDIVKSKVRMGGLNSKETVRNLITDATNSIPHELQAVVDGRPALRQVAQRARRTQLVAECGGEGGVFDAIATLSIPQALVEQQGEVLLL